MSCLSVQWCFDGAAILPIPCIQWCRAGTVILPMSCVQLCGRDTVILPMPSFHYLVPSVHYIGIMILSFFQCRVISVRMTLSFFQCPVTDILENPAGAAILPIPCVQWRRTGTVILPMSRVQRCYRDTVCMTLTFFPLANVLEDNVLPVPRVVVAVTLSFF